MTASPVLVRHFSRMGARLKMQEPARWQGERVRIDVARDRSGEYFDLRCQRGAVPEVLDVEERSRHLVMMVREGQDKNKYLLGNDEGHWFAAAVPGLGVHDVRSAMESLRPVEAEGKRAIRQGEWFFVPALMEDGGRLLIYRNEPISRGGRSKPHICEQLPRRAGVPVMVCEKYPAGLTETEYHELLAQSRAAKQWRWTRMTRDAEVFARGSVRHRDHKTVYLDGWHHVYLNRERFARHARQVAFLD